MSAAQTVEVVLSPFKMALADPALSMMPRLCPVGLIGVECGKGVGGGSGLTLIKVKGSRVGQKGWETR